MTDHTATAAAGPLPLFLANRPLETVDTLAVTDKFSGEVFAQVCVANT